MPDNLRTWDHETDFLVIGSGAAGMTAALVARLEGLDSLVLEKTDLFGGSTAISGGGVWIPNNHLMERAGLHDSFENASLYLRHTVGDRTPWSRQEAFLTHGPRMLRALMDRAHLRFRMAEGFPDYYPELPGGAATGRTLYVPVFAGCSIGPRFARLRNFEAAAPRMVPLSLQEYKQFVLFRRSPVRLVEAVRVLSRSAFGAAFRRGYVGMGRALAASLLGALDTHGVPIRLETGLRELVLDGGRVIGAVTESGGKVCAIRARKGVLLAAGGFARNAAMRERYLPRPVSTEWTSANMGDTGEVIRLAIALGAAVDLMDDAWWGPTIIPPGEPPLFILIERAYPGSIMVDAAGRRFANEAASYVDVVHRMYEHNDKVGGAIPAHLVLDHRFRSRYFLGVLQPGHTPARLVRNGFITVAGTLRELAGKAGIDPDGLERTVARFNEFARTGKDLDFQRGDSEFDRSYADPTVGPNPSLGPIDTPPFYSVKVFPGDLGTKGGVVTDEHAQVLREDGSVIEGLYAAGNTAASVMGNTYPGGGATLGPAMTFAYLAAKHAATGGRN